MKTTLVGIFSNVWVLVKKNHEFVPHTDQLTLSFVLSIDSFIVYNTCMFLFEKIALV